MSRLIRSLRFKRQALVTEKKLQVKCSKCEKRIATDADNLCDHCRFENVLTGIVEKR